MKRKSNKVRLAMLRFDRKDSTGDALVYPSAFDDLRDVSISFAVEYKEFIESIHEDKVEMMPGAVY